MFDGAGLQLVGMIVSHEILDKEFEQRKYKQQRIGISDGSNTYTITKSSNDGSEDSFHRVEVFRKARFKITSARTEKGGMILQGDLAAIDSEQ